MRVELLFTPYGIDKSYFKGKSTVVIDILRATTSMTAALSNGARSIIPVDTIRNAFELAEAGSEDHILAGEHNTHRIEGFSLGNSPLEFDQETVKDKSIIFLTTNGTKAIVKARLSENLLICSFNNLENTAETICNLSDDVIILCSGTDGLFSKEDTYCGGRLIERISRISDNIEMSDSAEAAVSLCDQWGTDILRVLKASFHGKKLMSNGFEKDLYFASQLNNVALSPYYSDGEIKAESL